MKFNALALVISVVALSGCAGSYETREKFSSTDGRLAQIDARDSKIEESVNQVKQTMAREIARVDETHKRDIAQVEETHKRDIARVDETHKRDIARVEETHKREIARVDDAHSKDVAKLNADIKETMRIAKGKFAYITGPNVTTIQFDKASTKVSDADEQNLVGLAKSLLGENKNVFVEIRGYADVRGAKRQNEFLAINRAEAVRQILSENGVALHRMSIIALPQRSADGKQTEEDLARDRRVTITIVE